MNLPGNNKGLALLTAAVGICFIIALIFFLTRGGENETPEEGAVPSETSAAVEQRVEPDSQQPTRIDTVIAPVGKWSENYSVPPRHWCRIVPLGKIKVKTWDGREIDDEPGKDTWLGHDVLDANFRFTSRESTEVKVAIVLTPK